MKSRGLWCGLPCLVVVVIVVVRSAEVVVVGLAAGMSLVVVVD